MEAHLGSSFARPPRCAARQSQPHRFYVEQLATMRERELNTLYVNFEHLLHYDMVRPPRLAPAPPPAVTVRPNSPPQITRVESKSPRSFKS
jgi:hypothetical protein